MTAMTTIYRNLARLLLINVFLLFFISCSQDDNKAEETSQTEEEVIEDSEDTTTDEETTDEETTDEETTDEETTDEETTDEETTDEETTDEETTDEETTDEETTDEETTDEETTDEETTDEETTDEETTDEETTDDNDDMNDDMDDPSDGTTGSTENLIWSEEFEGNSLDESKWSYQRGTWNGASNVRNCYVDDNTSVSGGTLKITAKYEPGYDCFQNERDFTSGFIQTKDRVSWTYGYFEARVKVPASDSTWPAFWLSPQDNVYGIWPRSGEIDVFEIRGHDLNLSHGNAHWGNSTSDRRQQSGTYRFQGQDALDWHVYAVEWTLGELKFYIDGEHYHTINNFRAPNATTDPGPFNIPFYIRLNMAVGGNYLGQPHSDPNNNIDQLPATMEVDYVRVYSEKPEF